MTVGGVASAVCNVEGQDTQVTDRPPLSVAWTQSELTSHEMLLFDFSFLHWKDTESGTALHS